MPPNFASARFLLRNAAFIARGLLTRCAGPSLLRMKLHQYQSLYPSSSVGQRTLDMGLGRLVVRVLLRVAVALLIAIPLFIVVVTAFAPAGRREPRVGRPAPDTRSRAGDIHSRETQHLRAAD